MHSSLTPTFEEFVSHVRAGYTTVPVARRFAFDTHTAVTAYANLFEPPFGFLLESVVGAEKWARYTFLGSAPREVVRAGNDGLAQWTPAAGWQPLAAADPFTYLAGRLVGQRVAPVPGLPRFFGGVVGYLGYDTVRHLEQLGAGPADDLALPEAMLMFTGVVVAIDNVFGHALAIACVHVENAPTDAALRTQYETAMGDVDRAIARVLQPSRLAPLAPAERAGPARTYSSTFTQPEFEAGVRRIREYIQAGDAFQVVLSQRLKAPLPAPPLELYRRLRGLNPSPYLYLLELDGLALVGSSPEVLVRVDNRRVIVRPIAGTRRRGLDEAEDARMAAELLADQKERAEHLMLIDLGRNDVGRVTRFGTVRVSEYMGIERYSHVLHMVSQVEGELADGLSAIDVLRACFPAGTVSGAPKIRAMEIIDELEPVRRGPYGGAVGFFSHGGLEMDTAIAIRTLVAAGGHAYVQAGAGVVADSDPAREFQETLEKAGALLKAMDG